MENVFTIYSLSSQLSAINCHNVINLRNRKTKTEKQCPIDRIDSQGSWDTLLWWHIPGSKKHACLVWSRGFFQRYLFSNEEGLKNSFHIRLSCISNIYADPQRHSMIQATLCRDHRVSFVSP